MDDDDLVRMATAEMLRDVGHEVAEASSAAAALGMLRSGAVVDLLITDYLMPEMRGLALVLAARAMRPELPALLVTGYATMVDAEAGDVPRITKPFREADLAREVARLLPQGAVTR